MRGTYAFFMGAFLASFLTAGHQSVHAQPKPQATPLQELTDIRGKEHRPFSHKNTRAAVLVFITVDCPIANSYCPTMNQLSKEYSRKGFSLYLVHPDPDITGAAAKKHAKDFKLQPPVVRDPKQILVRYLKAKMTPEAFVVDRKGKILYRGRIDNLYEDYGKKRQKATKHDLKAALDAIVAGQPVPKPRTKAIGCDIALIEEKLP
ncbi:MAG: redoxin domain-containing protein [Gemmataceae bacterium]